jgi:hypothetical protein
LTYKNISFVLGFHNLLTKLKNFIISPKTKLRHLTTSKEMSSTTLLRQYSTSYVLPSSTIPTSNTISLPFTYYHQSPIKKIPYNESSITKTTNFDKISAWLDHTELIPRDDHDFFFIDDIQQQSISPSPIPIDHSSTYHLSKLHLKGKKTSSCVCFQPNCFISNIQLVLTPNIDSYL